MQAIRKSELKTIRSGNLPAAGAWDVAGDALELHAFDYSEVTFWCTYAAGAGGSGNAVEVRFEASPSTSGDDWSPLEEVIDTGAAVTTGQVTVIPVRTVVTKYIGAQSSPAHTVRLGSAQRVRCIAREVGDTAHPGAFTVRASATTGGV